MKGRKYSTLKPKAKTILLFTILILKLASTSIINQDSSEKIFKTETEVHFKFKDMEISKTEEKNLTSIIKIKPLKEDKFLIRMLLFTKNRFWSDGFSFRFTLKKTEKGNILVENFANYYSGKSLILESDDNKSMKVQTSLTLPEEFNGEIQSLKGMKLESKSLQDDFLIGVTINTETNFSPIKVKSKYLWYILLAFVVQIGFIVAARLVAKDVKRVPIFGLILSNFYVIACFHCYIRALFIQDRHTATLLYLAPYLSFFNIFLLYQKKKPSNSNENSNEDYNTLSNGSEKENQAKGKNWIKKIERPWILIYSIIGILVMLAFDWIWPIALNVTIAATVNYGVALENMLYVRKNTTALLSFGGYFLYVLILYFMCYSDNNVNLDIGDTGEIEKVVFFLSGFKLTLSVSIVWWKYGWDGDKKKTQDESLGEIA